jgi:hypothetical protein
MASRFWAFVGTIALLPLGLLAWPAWGIALALAGLLAVGPLILLGLFVFALFFTLPHWLDSNPWLTLGWLVTPIIGIPLAYLLIAIARPALLSRAFRWSANAYVILLAPVLFVLYWALRLAGIAVVWELNSIFDLVGPPVRSTPLQRAIHANTDAVREQTGIIAGQWR